jgi:FdhD protein
VQITDETGHTREVHVVSEYPLTIKVNDRELVTLMTAGTDPTDLVLGYLHNQGLIENLDEILDIRIDRERQIASVTTRDGQPTGWESKIGRRMVTSGCGEGTIFSCSLEKIYEQRLAPQRIRAAHIYDLLHAVKGYSRIYALAGSVHTCALCRLPDEVLIFVEDVGRHNAADTIGGKMWVRRIQGTDKILYTTGRVTSEIVMKAAIMKIPTLLSRSGVTQMGLEIAQDLNMMIIARAKGKKFQVFSGREYFAPK